jgi:signal transduction histidine kinase
VSIQLGQWNVDNLTLKRVLDFLPYPFLISEMRGGVLYNSFANRKFIEEIGYTVEQDIPTIKDWYERAYPDKDYRESVIADWDLLIKNAHAQNEDSIFMKALIQTRHHGKRWYEVKSSLSGEVQLIAFVNIHAEISKEEDLLRLNENKNRTLAILSHDLRGPITNLHTLSQLALNKHLTQSEFLETVQNVQEKTFQVLEFLDTTLHWTRSNFDNISLKIDRIDLHSIILKILTVYENSCSLKSLKVLTNLMPYPEIESDQEIIIIVLRNLISNAIKFTPDNGCITVHTGREDGKALLAVEDNGIGMSEPMIHRIFSDEFHSQQGTRQEKGLGIGLRLCGELLKKIGGTITIKSVLGKGTVVKINFPDK